MTTWMFIDSDSRQNGAVADFVIESEQTSAWSQFQRSDGAQSCCTAGAACLVNATVVSLLVHYDTVVSYDPVPLLKIHLYNLETRDIRLVNAMSTPAGPPVEFTFVAELRPYLSGSLSAPTPGWAAYYSPMRQRMRMRRNGAFAFRALDARTDRPIDALRVQCTVGLD